MPNALLRCGIIFWEKFQKTSHFGCDVSIPTPADYRFKIMSNEF
jgi:hypothetical protein